MKERQGALGERERRLGEWGKGEQMGEGDEGGVRGVGGTEGFRARGAAVQL